MNHALRVAHNGSGGVTQSFQTASNFNSHEMSIQNAGRDMIIVNPAPISGAEASIEEITAWLKGANFRAIYRLSLEARMDNTGTWLIATFEFGEFVKQKGMVVWATGLPGSGKTILASISVEHLEDTFSGRPDVAILYAFLRYSEKHTLLQIIAGLLSQLVSSHAVALTHILPSYQRAKKHRDELSCSEAVRALKVIVSLFSDTYIVIDGLDEVDDTTKDGLLRVLTSLQAHILVTCRPLELFMRRHTPQALHIPVQAQTRDIEVYVTERIRESTKLEAILKANPAVSDSFTRLIKEKSQGMFLLARLQMELVLEKCTTIGSLLKALETLPTGVNDMYQVTMNRINSQSEEDASIANRTFIWLLHARGPLSPEDVQHALTFSYQDLVFHEENLVSIPMLLSICCGLVTVEVEKETGKNVVRFIHYSTQEFMNTLPFIGFPHPHSLLAVTSVACVEPSLAAFVSTLDSRLKRLPASPNHPALGMPLLKYALHHWGHHTKVCELQGISIPFIQSFLSKHDVYVVMHYEYRSPQQPFEGCGGLALAVMHDLVNLISSGTLSYTPTHGTETPFHIASKLGRIAALRALLRNYSGVHVRDEDGCTPLHFVYDVEVAQTLLDLSPTDLWRAFPSEVIDINAQDEEGMTAFFRVCIGYNADYNHWTSYSVWHPNGASWKLLRLLASIPNIDPNLPTQRQETAFSNLLCKHEIHQERRDSEKIARFLTSTFPNLTVDNYSLTKETPFMRACTSFMHSLVAWFLSRNCSSDPDFLCQEDEKGLTALEQMVDRGWLPLDDNDEESQDGPLEAQDEEKQGGLFDLPEVRFSNDNARALEVMDMLTSHGGIVRVSSRPSTQGSLPIYHLGTSGSEECLFPAVCLNDSPARRYEDGRTALMLLATFPLAVGYLISRIRENEIQINAQDDTGRCALMYACFGQDTSRAFQSVAVFISFPSIDIHLRDRDCMSALDYAVYSRNSKALDVLLEHPSWDPPTLANAVITAAQNHNIVLRDLLTLLQTQKVRNLNAADGEFADFLKATLRSRPDCTDFLVEMVAGASSGNASSRSSKPV
ncbi:hypothetical protein DFP72DRAFT_574848 [Ephemerocybe angulata]|uniref:Nephrocystin 3-like N-terminal domain-containing protein n=1 Tax=Ephemerocybe angulata TaxID=980116 RepID=A0A8H6HLE5_9AGAR|nr:hypothetical protein DFP72DRAFT_574848 [Tulosesus angulatus]